MTTQSFRARWFFVLSLLACAGCIKMEVYFQPKLEKTADTELPRWSEPLPVVVEVDHAVNGKPEETYTKESTKVIVRALDRTKLFKISDKAAYKLVVRVREEFDEVELMQRARAAGGSFGRHASVSQTKLSFEAQIFNNGTLRLSRSKQVTANIALGNQDIPPEYEPIPILDANDAMVNSFVRSILRDAYRAGVFPQVKK